MYISDAHIYLTKTIMHLVRPNVWNKIIGSQFKKVGSEIYDTRTKYYSTESNKENK